MPKVSIIVPVYNAESCLDKCLQSILDQTFNDFEVILVDDGSKDRSGEICDEYALNDGRIKVVHQSNAGTSAARNAGLNCACGDYVIFADSDDWVKAEMMQNMFDFVEKDNADIVYCDYFEFYNENDVRTIRQDNGCEKDGCIKALLNGNMHGSLCNKLIRRSLFTDNYIHFPDGYNIYEDLLAVIKCFVKAKRIAYDKNAYYYYRFADSSLSRNISMTGLSNKIMSTTHNTELIEQFLGEEQILDRFAEDMNKRKLMVKEYILNIILLSISKYSSTFAEVNGCILNKDKESWKIRMLKRLFLWISKMIN